jgi:hypothetical protein
MVVDINTKLKDYMDQDKINLKYFIIITSILNTLIGYLLIKSIVEYREATNSYNYLDSSKSELNQILNKPEYKNLKESDVRYQNYIEKINPSEGIPSYTNLVSNLANENNLGIIETKVLNSNERYFEVQNVIQGDIGSIKNFINSIERESGIKEIRSSNIKFINNKIQIELIVRTYKIK